MGHDVLHGVSFGQAGPVWMVQDPVTKEKTWGFAISAGARYSAKPRHTQSTTGSGFLGLTTTPTNSGLNIHTNLWPGTLRIQRPDETLKDRGPKGPQTVKEVENLKSTDGYSRSTNVEWNNHVRPSTKRTVREGRVSLGEDLKPIVRMVTIEPHGTKLAHQSWQQVYERPHVSMRITRDNAVFYENGKKVKRLAGIRIALPYLGRVPNR